MLDKLIRDKLGQYVQLYLNKTRVSYNADNFDEHGDTTPWVVSFNGRRIAAHKIKKLAMLESNAFDRTNLMDLHRKAYSVWVRQVESDIIEDNVKYLVMRFGISAIEAEQIVLQAKPTAIFEKEASVLAQVNLHSDLSKIGSIKECLDLIFNVYVNQEPLSKLAQVAEYFDGETASIITDACYILLKNRKLV